MAPSTIYFFITNPMCCHFFQESYPPIMVGSHKCSHFWQNDFQIWSSRRHFFEATVDNNVCRLVKFLIVSNQLELNFLFRGIAKLISCSCFLNFLSQSIYVSATISLVTRYHNISGKSKQNVTRDSLVICCWSFCCKGCVCYPKREH